MSEKAVARRRLEFESASVGRDFKCFVDRVNRNQKLLEDIPAAAHNAGQSV